MRKLYAAITKYLANAFCVHDWAVLERSCTDSIKYKVANELDPLMPGDCRPKRLFGRELVRKECLKCGKHVDQLGRYREAQRKRVETIIAKFGVEAIEPRLNRERAGFLSHHRLRP